MPETRLLQKMTPRSTGIPGTQQNVRAVGATAGASSHVSASAGAGKRAHDHAAGARSPGGGRQDAKVEIIERQPPGAGAASGRPGATQRPSVQVVDRVRQPASPFDADEIAMMLPLVEQFGERVSIVDQAQAAIARSAVDKLVGLSQTAPARGIPQLAPPTLAAANPQGGVVATTTATLLTREEARELAGAPQGEAGRAAGLAAGTEAP